MMLLRLIWGSLMKYIYGKNPRVGFFFQRRRGVKVRLDKTRRLRFTPDSYIKACELLDISPGESIGQRFISNPVDFLTQKTLAWAALIHEDPGLSVEDAARILRENVADGLPSRLLSWKLMQAVFNFQYELSRQAKIWGLE